MYIVRARTCTIVRYGRGKHMKRALLIATILGAAVTVYLVIPADPPATLQPVAVPPDEATTAPPSNTTPVQVLTEEPQPVTTQEESQPNSSTEMRRARNPGDEEIWLAHGPIVVKRVVTDCYDVTRSDGTFRECDTELVIDNPYEKLTDVELAEQAEFDSAAASTYGVRLLSADDASDEQIELAKGYFIRSIALDQESQSGYMAGFIGYMGLGWSTNPEPDDARLIESYVWTRAGVDLGLIEGKDLDPLVEAMVDRDLLKPPIINQALALKERIDNQRLELTGTLFIDAREVRSEEK